MGRHLRSFTASFKLQVTEYAEEHGKREAGRKYDVDEKRVRYWIKQKDALAATNRSRKAFRGKKCKYPELEGELVKYVIDTRNDGYAVSTDMVRVKALNIARHMEIPKAQFKASRGWATRFMNRNQLSIRRRTELGHLTDRVKDRLATTRTDLAVIPGGLTSVLQPLDVCINRPFKTEFRRCYSEWMAGGHHEKTPTGRLKRASLQQVCAWILSAWRAVSLETVAKSFKVTGISNSMDGTEDDRLWGDADAEASSSEGEDSDSDMES